MEKRLKQVETENQISIDKITALEDMVKTLHTELMQMKVATDSSPALHTRVENMATQINAQRTDLDAVTVIANTTPGPSRSRGDYQRNSAVGEPAYEIRTEAVLMNVLPPPQADGIVMIHKERKDRSKK